MIFFISKLSQNQHIQAALDDQRRQNAELQKQNEQNLYSLNRKEFEIEKDKTVRAFIMSRPYKMFINKNNNR